MHSKKTGETGHTCSYCRRKNKQKYTLLKQYREKTQKNYRRARHHMYNVLQSYVAPVGFYITAKPPGKISTPSPPLRRGYSLTRQNSCNWSRRTQTIWLKGRAHRARRRNSQKSKAATLEERLRDKYKEASSRVSRPASNQRRPINN